MGHFVFLRRAGIVVADVEKLQNTEASQIHIERVNATEVPLPSQGERFVFPWQMVQSIWQDKVAKSEHPTYLGEIPNAEKNTAVYFTEKRTISLLLTDNKSKMTWKPGTTVGVVLEIKLAVVTFIKKVKLHVPKESSFVIPLKVDGCVRQKV